MAIAYTDDFGLFVFDGINYNLSPGNYRLVGFADGYQKNISPQISVAAFEQVDIGDFALTPLPIQFVLPYLVLSPLVEEYVNLV
ncbi:carboxypeptidase-like regulatory domain-containing protein [Paraglaciecola sp. MB-3u-78]|uniref:carboxypeptidase-like regulatory domain-containing protein n=1 Tax=Paraglaciecola sp. MB-3u-78 TaxID=2058332 RepID=UPI0012FEF570|nr:carboxypeptidase-like regulatory domain-containing protein [Paraglaciecola sp. MB-3u-78]